jgi:hypothetical protein
MRQLSGLRCEPWEGETCWKNEFTTEAQRHRENFKNGLPGKRRAPLLPVVLRSQRRQRPQRELSAISSLAVHSASNRRAVFSRTRFSLSRRAELAVAFSGQAKACPTKSFQQLVTGEQSQPARRQEIHHRDTETQRKQEKAIRRHRTHSLTAFSVFSVFSQFFLSFSSVSLCLCGEQSSEATH